MSHSPEELKGIAIAGRVSSVLSILGSFTIIGAFSLSRHFRSPIHRIIFFNSFYNLFDSVATMISTSGPAAGDTSSLCQFQGFALQMFPVADVLWTFAMALDTYLVVFHHFDTQSLRKLELKYIGVISTLSFIPAFVFLFIRGREKGPIYGDETLDDPPNNILLCARMLHNRLIIVIVLILYCLIGIEITRVRDEFKLSDDDHIALTSGNSASSVTTVEANSRRKPGFTPESTITSNTTEQDIEQDTIQRPYPPGRAPTTYQTPQQRRVSLRQYVIMPSLFFLAMLATWIAPTINRISEFVHRKHGTHSLLLAGGRGELRRGEWLLGRLEMVAGDVNPILRSTCSK
ncbi:Pc22g21700 [Penicillium rubens Wisconsin 54-1255]|uniref:Pc22g21700 protein n=1 Tax=Penicillium rubens (strain ATCC 28089 / DSM 1075 / NRRL 1951 / Wisconsin 54-1255) TaxID=500485 RepID=B6HSY3_PENRW|nr:Pc22g21700 [Penicillium rubens Wisconsin 54-1255]